MFLVCGDQLYLGKYRKKALIPKKKKLYLILNLSWQHYKKENENKEWKGGDKIAEKIADLPLSPGFFILLFYLCGPVDLWAPISFVFLWL